MQNGIRVCFAFDCCSHGGSYVSRVETTFDSRASLLNQSPNARALARSNTVSWRIRTGGNNYTPLLQTTGSHRLTWSCTRCGAIVASWSRRKNQSDLLGNGAINGLAETRMMMMIRGHSSSTAHFSTEAE